MEAWKLSYQSCSPAKNHQSKTHRIRIVFEESYITNSWKNRENLSNKVMNLYVENFPGEILIQYNSMSLDDHHAKKQTYLD